MTRADPTRVLIIAGHDPSGCAGALADARAITELGGFALAVATAATVQSSRNVAAVHPLSPALLQDQIHAITEDIRIDAVKIGLLPTVEHVRVVTRCVAGLGVPWVVDPVLRSTSGAHLVAPGVSAVLAGTCAQATLLTPNAEEATALGIIDRAWTTGRAAVLITGGDAPGDRVVDQLWVDGEERSWARPRVAGGPFRGTGCALSSSIAVALGRGHSLQDAVNAGIEAVVHRLSTAFTLGAGPMVL